MYNTHCIIQGCKTTVYNRLPGVTFFQCPSSSEMRNKWLHVLKNKCSSIDWPRSKICSRHFEHKYFDSQRKLKDNAVPTLFPAKSMDSSGPKLDKLLNKLTQSELTQSIKEDMRLVSEPFNLENSINENVKCKPGSSEVNLLWLIIKKQEHLNSRLTEAVIRNRRHTNLLQRTIDEMQSKRRSRDQSIDTNKYIIRCLQEKLATYEEQIDILTNVEII